MVDLRSSAGFESSFSCLVKWWTRGRFFHPPHQMARSHDEHDLSHTQHARHPAEGAGVPPGTVCERVNAPHRTAVLRVHRALVGPEGERVGAAGGGKPGAGSLPAPALSAPRPMCHAPVSGEGDAAAVEVGLQNVPD